MIEPARPAGLIDLLQVGQMAKLLLSLLLFECDVGNYFDRYASGIFYRGKDEASSSLTFPIILLMRTAMFGLS